MADQKQQKRIRRDISGWLVLNKATERCQKKWLPLFRFGSATIRKSYGWTML